MTRNARTIAAAAALALASAAGVTAFEGRRYTVYHDAGGIPTVCDGITGEDVIAGKRYTDAECDALLAKRMTRIVSDLQHCVTADLDVNEWRAYLDLAYNIGTPAFCRSTIVKLRNAGDKTGACAQISRWTFVAGEDCRATGSRCPGIVKRRAYERQLCESSLH